MTAETAALLGEQPSERKSRRASPEARPAKKVKVTISLTERQYGDLVNLANERGITLSALVTRGVALQKFLLEHKDAEVLLKTGDETQRVVLVD